MEMQEALSSTISRSFFKTFFSVLGFAFAFLPLLLIFNFLGSTAPADLRPNFAINLLPDEEGGRHGLHPKSSLILHINIKGIIGSEELNTDRMRALLQEAGEGRLKNNPIKALFLHINSPGGTVSDSHGIYEQIKQYKEEHKIPVYAYIEGLCASGGMYIASSADKVFANDSSLIGSIGVILPTFFNAAAAIEKLGIESRTLSSGKGKDAMNPFRDWSEDEGKSYQSIINFYYDQFVDIVTQARPALNREKLINEYGAKVFPAPLAKEYGFIDEAATSLEKALAALSKKADLSEYQVIELHTRHWLNKFFTAKSPLFTGKVEHHLQVREIDPRLAGKFLYYWKAN